MVWSRSITSLFCMWKFSCPVAFVENTFSHTEWTWHPCHKSIAHRYIDSIPLVYMSIFASITLFLLLWLCNKFWKCESYNFFLLLQDFFGYLWSLAISYEFQNQVIHFMQKKKKKGCWDFDKDCIRSLYYLG